MDIQFLWVPSPSPTPTVTIHFRLNLYHFLPSLLPPSTGCHKYMVSMSLEFGFWIAPNCPLSIDNDITICWHDVIVNFFFDVAFVSLFKFIDWSKFHVNIITDSGVMTIFLYKGLTRNLDIGNTSVWVLPNIWRLGQVRDTEFGTNVSNVMVLNATKCQAYSVYPFWAIKGEPTSSGKKYFC